jgi:MFS family permease
VSVIYGVLGVLLIIVLPAYLAGRVARRKGRTFGVYFAAGLIVGPLALLIALILPRRRLI